MIAVGLTGSVGMGKTAAANAFAQQGYPVFSADAEVHRLLAEDARILAAVCRAFPDAVRGGGVDRAALGARVFRDADALRRLEAILHPRVRAAELRFLKEAKAAAAPLAVLEIPLLFETGAERLCDVVVVVSASAKVQAARVLKRPGMTRARLRTMRARQISDVEKRRRADYVVDTGGPKPKMLRQVREIIKILDPDR